MAVSCVWMTIADWVALTAQDPEVFDNVVRWGGPTYTRVCADGTVWLNETLALTIVGTLP